MTTMVNNDDEDSWIRQIIDRHRLDKDSDDGSSSDSPCESGSSSESDATSTEGHSEENRMGEETSLESLASNVSSELSSTVNLAARLSLRFKDLKEKYCDSCSSLDIDDLKKLHDSIPSTLYIPPQHNPDQEDDLDATDLLQLAQKRLESSINKTMAAIEELRAELDVLVALYDDSTAGPDNMCERLKSVLKLAPALEIHFTQVIKPLLEGTWMQSFYNESFLVTLCRLAFIATAIARFYRQFLVNVGQNQSFQGGGGIWDIRSYIVSSTLVALLEHEIFELTTSMEISFSGQTTTTTSGPFSLKFTMSEDFQSALQMSGHHDAFQILLRVYGSHNKKDCTEGAPGMFRQVCRDVMLSMGDSCPVDPEAVSYLCSEDPRVWHELLESHLHRRCSARISISVVDLKEVLYIDSAEGLAPVPTEARNVLEKLPGPLLRREALESILRRLVPPNMPGINKITTSSCLTFIGDDDEETRSSDKPRWCDSQACSVAAVSSSPKASISKGMGKTTLAAIAVHYPEVREIYTDGIVWLCLNGLRACDLNYLCYRKLLEDAVHQFQEREMLGASQHHHLKKNSSAILFPDYVPSNYVSTGNYSNFTRQKCNNFHQEQGLMNYARSLMVDFLRGKKVLFVLDDVVDGEMLEWFQFSSQPSESDMFQHLRRSSSSKLPMRNCGVFTLLATTDNNSLLPATNMVEIGEVTSDDAINLMNLRSFLTRMDSENLVQSIICSCSYHPLALSCIRRILDLRTKDAHEVEGESTWKLHCLQRLYEAVQANRDVLMQILDISMQPDILYPENSDDDAKAKCLRLKTCFVGFAVIFCDDPSNNDAVCPLISDDAIDCLFRCLLSLKCINWYCGKNEATEEVEDDEAVSIRQTLVRLGFLQNVSRRDGGNESKTCPTKVETDTGSNYVRLMHSIYREYAHSLARDDSALRQALGENMVQELNRAYASFLFLSLASLPLSDKFIAGECDERHMYREWETIAPDQTPLLEYGLRKLPMHLLRAELYDEAIDLLGSNRFAYDRVFHQCGTTEGIRSVVEQHLHNVSYLMANLPTSYDRKAILRKAYLPLGNHLMQVLEDCNCSPIRGMDDGEEKKFEEPEPQITESKKDERVKEVGEAFLAFGISLMDHHFYEPAIKFWKTSYETLALYHGTKNVLTVAAILQNMGILYRDALNDYDKAIECLTDCLAIRRSIYGDRHILAAQTLRELSVCFIGIGTFDDAKTALSLAKNMLNQKPRLYRDEIGEIQTCMGLLHCKFSDYILAMGCFQKALLSWTAEHGEESEHLAFVYEQIGRCQFELGSYDSAGESISKAQELLGRGMEEQTMTQKDHDATILNLQGMLSHLAGCYDESLGHYKRAAVLYREIISDIGETTSRSHYLDHRLATTLYDIGRVNLKLSNNSEALRYFEESLDTRCIDSTSHRRAYQLFNVLEAADTLCSMSKAYEKQGQLGKALRSLGESLKIRDKFCSNSEVLALTHLEIASVASAKRDSTKAQAALQAALDIRRKLHHGDESHDAVVSVLNKLHRLIEDIW